MDCWFFISLGLKCCGNVHETGRLKQSVWWTIQLISPRGVKNKFTIAELKKKGQKQEFHKTVITLVRATRHWMLRLPDAKTSLCVCVYNEWTVFKPEYKLEFLFYPKWGILPDWVGFCMHACISESHNSGHKHFVNHHNYQRSS